MFQNMLMTALAPLSKTDEIKDWENRPFSVKFPEIPYDNGSKTKGHEISKTIKKKSKRVRTAYTTNQLRALEQVFLKTKYIDTEARKQLADSLTITEKSIKIWFQNRRMKEKRESESSCDSSINESISISASPPSNNQQKDVITHSPDSTISSYSEFNTPNFDCTTQQYQFPQYTNYVQYQNELSNTASNMFYCDNTAYPTEYYPTYQYYHQNNFVQTQNFDNNNWAHNNYNCGYYY